MKFSVIALLITFSTFADSSVVKAPKTLLERLGERIFRDMRFSEHFYRVSAGDPNFLFMDGSEHLKVMNTNSGVKISPFKGQTQSCTSCHMADQSFMKVAMRGYNDFDVLTPVPKRKDGRTHTLRNTPTLVGIGSKYNQNRFSHYDGELADHSETVLGNFTGRNMGWLASEKEIALKNIANVIRKDRGNLFRSYPEDFQSILEINVDHATDSELHKGVVRAVVAFMNQIDFQKDNDGFYNGSPYDEFLKRNGIDRGPVGNETVFQYRNRIRVELNNLFEPEYVEPKRIPTQKASYGFGPEAFRGLQIFMNLKGDDTGNSQGMCLVCHVPPSFSDQFFHNIGVSQFEYDAIHGEGEFAKIEVPSLADRKDEFFLKRAHKNNPGETDLGVWNFYKRRPELTKYLNESFCRPNQDCPEERILDALIARVKTTTLRNLGHSEPYFHNGSAKTIEETIIHYKDAAELFQQRRLRNPAPQLHGIRLTDRDIKSLTEFLKSLNESFRP